MERVAKLVYSEHQRYGFDDEDDAAEALMKYRGRISKLVDRFEDRGLSFDAYLASSLRYLARTVRRDRQLKTDREFVCERMSDLSYREDEGSGLRGKAGMVLCSHPSPASEPFGRRRQKRRPRARGGSLPTPAEAAYSSRLIFLAIKCAWEIDEESIERVAAASGVDPSWLGAAIAQARRSLVSESERVDYLMQRRNASWCRQRLLQARLAEETDQVRRTRLELSLNREKDRYEKVLAAISQFRIIVPNSVVARIVGVPKGTVDSGLYYLRKRHSGTDGALLHGQG
jgi:hypothetical protein